MSSVTCWMPSWSASAVASRSDAGSLSCSGMNTPNTFVGPTARTANAAQTELSTPLLIATTYPRRLNDSARWRRIAATIASVAAAGSNRRRVVIEEVMRCRGCVRLNDATDCAT